MYLDLTSDTGISGPTVEVVMTIARTEYDRVCAERDALQITCTRLEVQRGERRSAIEEVAHKLNNKIGGVLGSAELLLQKIDDRDPSRPRVQAIRSAALDSADLVAQLLQRQ